MNTTEPTELQPGVLAMLKLMEREMRLLPPDDGARPMASRTRGKLNLARAKASWLAFVAAEYFRDATVNWSRSSDVAKEHYEDFLARMREAVGQAGTQWAVVQFLNAAATFVVSEGDARRAIEAIRKMGAEATP